MATHVQPPPSHLPDSARARPADTSEPETEGASVVIHLRPKILRFKVSRHRQGIAVVETLLQMVPLLSDLWRREEWQ